jgi:hypothetical protein
MEDGLDQQDAAVLPGAGRPEQADVFMPAHYDGALCDHMLLWPSAVLKGRFALAG